MKVAIIVTDDFEQVELTEPRKALQQAGAETLIVAPKPGTVQGFESGSVSRVGDIRLEAYKTFDWREPGWMKVELEPALAA